MMNADTTITVFSSVYDETLGYDLYNATVISGVSWFGRVKTAVKTDGGLASADEYAVRIPDDRINDDSIFKVGNIIAKGLVALENPRPAEIFGAADSFTIIGVTDNRNKKGGHIRVVGK